MHAAPADADLAGLPELEYRSVAWTRGGVVSEGFQVDDSEATFVTALFGHEVGASD